MKTAHPLRKLTLLSVLAALAAPAAASAQAYVSVQVGLPVIQVGVPAVLPPLVVVQPGVQVVQGIGEEVFFVDGHYWARHGGGWYRARDHRVRFVPVEPRRVPGALVRIPEGHYRNWHPGRPHYNWRRPQYWRGPHPYQVARSQGPRHGEWDRAGWQHGARPHDPVTERRWTEARRGPSVRDGHGHGHR